MNREHIDTQVTDLLEKTRPEYTPALRARAVEVVMGVKPAGGRSWRLAVVCAVGVAILVIGLLLALGGHGILTHREPVVAVIAVRGPVSDENGRKLVIGDRLPGGAAVVTGAKARVTLVTRRGSEFTLAANTRLEIADNGKNADLEAGRLYCRNRMHEIAGIGTVAGRIALLGTTVDADTKDKDTVAVTVVEGSVRLENRLGEAKVESGKQAILEADSAPKEGQTVNTTAETAWYDGRGDVVSEAGEIAYLVPRADRLVTEVWVMNADGSNKHRIKTYASPYRVKNSPWLPGGRSLFIDAPSLSWARPDLVHHVPGLIGHPILESRLRFEGREWLLDTATGQDTQFSLPEGYWAWRREVSPDGRLLAFVGDYRPDPKTFKGEENGTWVYDMTTGALKKVLDSRSNMPPTWSPDSKLIATSAGDGYLENFRLVTIDIQTGEVQDLHTEGAYPSFSPDGTRLAYCTGIRDGRAVPAGVFVLNLAQRSAPVRVSAVESLAFMPRWSPDGTRILYWRRTHEQVGDQFKHTIMLFVANADGSGSHELYHTDGLVRAAEWARSGDAIYVVGLDYKGEERNTRPVMHIFTVATDGSGTTHDLGGTAEDSILLPAEKAQTGAAVADLREAMYQYEVGIVRSFEGKPAEAREAYQAAADLFSGLVWRHPLAGFSTADLAPYADNAQALADKPDDVRLKDACQQRLNDFLAWGFAFFDGDKRYSPASLDVLQKWLPTHDWGWNMNVDWINRSDTEWVNMWFQCPEGGEYVYHPPANGAYPKVGDVLVTCTKHPDCKLVWNRNMSLELRGQLQRNTYLAQRAKQKVK